MVGRILPFRALWILVSFRRLDRRLGKYSFLSILILGALRIFLSRRILLFNFAGILPGPFINFERCLLRDCVPRLYWLLGIRMLDHGVAMCALHIPADRLGFELRPLILTWRLGLPLFDGFLQIDVDMFGLLLLLGFDTARHHASFRLVYWR